VTAYDGAWRLYDDLQKDVSHGPVPSEPVPVVRLNPDTHKREFVHLHWGLFPAWVSDLSLGSRVAHARAETVATKRAFREAFSRRRCLVVVDSCHLSRRRKPYLIQMTDGQPFGMGRVWDRWQKDEKGPIESCAIITTAANEVVQPINDRMPVIIAPEDYDRWLDPDFYDAEELEQMMSPWPSDRMLVSPA
jgi:putative SOS response-associated peptidase YedK